MVGIGGDGADTQSSFAHARGKLDYSDQKRDAFVGERNRSQFNGFSRIGFCYAHER
jgi:hypothetical protein